MEAYLPARKWASGARGTVTPNHAGHGATVKRRQARGQLAIDRGRRQARGKLVQRLEIESHKKKEQKAKGQAARGHKAERRKGKQQANAEDKEQRTQSKKYKQYF